MQLCSAPGLRNAAELVIMCEKTPKENDPMNFIFRLMPPARWRILCMAMLVIAIILCIMSYSDDSLVYQNAAIIDLALAIGGTIFFWRCPRCRRMLPLKNMMYIKECQHCKADVRDFKY